MSKRNLVLLAVLLGFSIFSYGNSGAKNKSYHKEGANKTWLAGTTWSIVNKSIDSFYSGTTGQITFSTDTFTVDSGRFASAGIVAASENFDFCLKPLNPISYELIGNSLIYVTWVGQEGQDPTATLQQEAVITIDSHDKGRLVLVGEGGCGGSGIPRISILTNVNDKKHGNDDDDDDSD